uniref:Uncharacterized protein n=1 Tax=Trichinella nativa TaxID=6335 RepID=A0A0V1KJ36_9BILA
MLRPQGTLDPSKMPKGLGNRCPLEISQNVHIDARPVTIQSLEGG